MEADHNTFVWFSKSFGLFYLIAMAIAVVAYVFWPSNKKSFDRAAKSILRNRDKPGEDKPDENKP